MIKSCKIDLTEERIIDLLSKKRSTFNELMIVLDVRAIVLAKMLNELADKNLLKIKWEKQFNFMNRSLIAYTKTYESRNKHNHKTNLYLIMNYLQNTLKMKHANSKLLKLFKYPSNEDHQENNNRIKNKLSSILVLI